MLIEVVVPLAPLRHPERPVLLIQGVMKDRW
jgi:hypothetical protein